MTDLPKCKKCGDPAPPGKDLCWCCEHTPKLHKDADGGKRSESCEIVPDKRK